MDREEFLKEVEKLQKENTHGLIFRTEEINGTIAPHVWKSVDGIRGYCNYEDTLDFYKEMSQKIKDGGDVFHEAACLIRKRTGCGMMEASRGLEALINAIKYKPDNVMDNPWKMKITWEKENNDVL